MHLTWGGIHAFHASRLLQREDPPFAGLIFAAIRKADSANLERLKQAFPELVDEYKRRHNAPLGALPEDRIESMEVLEEQVGRMMTR